MKRKLLFESLIGGKLFKLYVFKGISLGHINFVEDTMRRKTLSISVLCLTIELFYYGR
tara:strand:- start:667 stop:840 length:174 start_codon:yes stop_codon:yes gene_type:complete